MSCPDCFRGGQAVGDPKGTLETIHGVPTYVAGPAPAATESKSTIIFFTDAFGLELVNNKLLADAYAAATGFRVLAPDIIPGGPAPTSVMPLMDSIVDDTVPLWNLWGQLVRIYKVIKLISIFGPFMYRARPSCKASFQASLEYTRKVKADLPTGTKLGAAGFCWGGYQSINLSAQPAVEGGSEPLIDAEFCAHPSNLSLPNDVVDAVTKFKVPIAVAHAEKDFALPLKQIEETEAILRQKAGTGDGTDGFNYEIKVYKGVGHGFAVRAKEGNQAEAEGAEEAKEQAIAWFKKWL